MTDWGISAAVPDISTSWWATRQGRIYLQSLMIQEGLSLLKAAKGVVHEVGERRQDAALQAIYDQGTFSVSCRDGVNELVSHMSQ